MSALVIGLASLRLAPVQAASFGHTATTASPTIDWMILPEDFVGDPACFTERLLRLPPAAMPYRMRDDFDYGAARERAAATHGAGGPVRIAVPASAMKLNPPFFDALARAAATARRPVAFHFLTLGAVGLGFAELERRLHARLPMAIAHEEAPYETYVERLAACDFFVCPFPYGNMNGIVDAALAGLPGVCLDGAEAHAHADAAYFRRLGFPPELVAARVDDYVAAIARLADEADWLAHCQAVAAAVGSAHAFFNGDASLFAGAAEQLIAETAARPG
jgi:predicted O-linked N-acetylglucosamine transferase (SPINDLY family)